MAGKRSAREVLDEWEQKMKEKAGAAVDSVQEATGTGGEINAAKFAYKHPTMAAGKDAIGMGGIGNSAGMMAADAVQGANDIYGQVQANPAVQDITAKIAQLPAQIQQQIQQAVQSGQMTMEEVAAQIQQMGSQPPAYDQEMMGYDMQPNDQTRAYYEQMRQQAQQAQRPITEKTGTAVGSLLDSAGGAYDKLKGIGGQFMQGMQGGQPQQAAPYSGAPAQGEPDRAASEQVIMQKLMSMSPEERNALVQKLQQQAGGM